MKSYAVSKFLGQRAIMPYSDIECDTSYLVEQADQDNHILEAFRQTDRSRIVHHCSPVLSGTITWYPPGGRCNFKTPDTGRRHTTARNFRSTR